MGITPWDASRPELNFTVYFKGMYDIASVASEYRRLPGIVDVDVPEVIDVNDHPRNYVCVESETRWSYLFEEWWDTCGGGGCLYVRDYHIASDAGVLEYVGTWSSDSGEPMPDWLTAFSACVATR